ncbi:MAG TPA: ABC transporter permease [Afifellaceae bacterium]|nr:ABC transporter permease [Afifellaceae bacterium]
MHNTGKPDQTTLRRRKRGIRSTHAARTRLERAADAARHLRARPGPGADPHSATRGTNPIVPPQSVARRTLLALVAIMSFLACLTVAAVMFVGERADKWQRQIANEVTIQIRPTDTSPIEDTVARAVDIAVQTPGVRSAKALSADDAARLLEPWLGSGFDRSELPVPRLIAVSVATEADLAALARRLRDEVPGASLDDHGLWLERLSSMARITTLGGFFILGLVMTATALCVVFATRGAMAGNRDVIEVLHFVGAEDSYVAAEFQRHFLILGLKGAGIGGLAAIILFALFSVFSRLQGPTPEEAQLRSLVGGVTIGWQGNLGIVATIMLIALIIAATARATVRRTLREID